MPLGVISLAVLLAVIYRRLRRKKAGRNQQGLAGTGDVGSMDQQDKAHHELLASTTKHEMPTGHAKHELPVPLSEFPGAPRYHELS